MSRRPAPGSGFWDERPGLLQRVGFGVSLTLGTGLAAVGLTGFLAISEMLPSSDAEWSSLAQVDESEPFADDAVAEEPPSDADPPPQESDQLSENALYRTGELGTVSCTLPELDESDPDSVEAFIHELADCLDEAWSDYFAEAGLEFTSPNRIYWHAAGHSPCGAFPSEGTAAFYCEANHGLYLGVEDIVAASADTDKHEAYTFLLTHEYGHHVQGQSGILAEFRETRAGVDQDEAEELTRRNELQANCLGGMFIGASSDSLGYEGPERENILDDAGHRSDRGNERTHGSVENGRLWTVHGMDRMDAAACNTWEAEEDLVQ